MGVEYLAALRLLLLVASLCAGCTVLTQRPDPPMVTLAGLHPIDFGLFEQRFRLRLRIRNPNPFPLPIAGMDYQIELNDRSFASGVARTPVTVPEFGERLLDVDVTSNLLQLLTQTQQLARGDTTVLRYRLSGGMGLVNRSFKLPFEHEGEVALRMNRP